MKHLSYAEFVALYGGVMLFWIFVWEMSGWGLDALRKRSKKDQ